MRRTLAFRDQGRRVKGIVVANAGESELTAPRLASPGNGNAQLTAEDARRLASALQRTDAALADVEVVLEAAVARREAKGDLANDGIYREFFNTVKSARETALNLSRHREKGEVRRENPRRFAT